MCERCYQKFKAISKDKNKEKTTAAKEEHARQMIEVGFASFVIKNSVDLFKIRSISATFGARG